MKKYPLYKLPIGYTIFYTLLILGSGIWLFLLSQGLSGSSSILAILHKIIVLPEKKSWQHFAEVAAPHLFAMGMLIFTVAHFMLFSTRVSQYVSLFVAMLLFAAALSDISVYGLIISGVVLSGWIKLVSISLFTGIFLVLLFMVYVSL